MATDRRFKMSGAPQSFQLLDAHGAVVSSGPAEADADGSLRLRVDPAVATSFRAVRLLDADGAVIDEAVLRSDVERLARALRERFDAET